MQVELAEIDAGQGQRHGDGAIRCQRAWFEDESGHPIARAHSGDRIVLAAVCEIAKDADDPVLGFALKSAEGAIVYSANTNWHGLATGNVRAGQSVELRATFVVPLRNGSYGVQFCVADRGLTRFHDAFDRAAEIVIHGSRTLDGATDLHAARFGCSTTRRRIARRRPPPRCPMSRTAQCAGTRGSGGRR
jgi:hypothetical protein